jgi:hypothetical protein
MDPRAGLDSVVKKKIPSRCRDSNPCSYSPSPSAIPLSYPRSLVFVWMKETGSIEKSAARTRL